MVPFYSDGRFLERDSEEPPMSRHDVAEACPDEAELTRFVSGPLAVLLAGNRRRSRASKPVTPVRSDGVGGTQGRNH